MSMPSPDATTPTDTSVPPPYQRSPNKPRTIPQHIRIRNRRKRYLETHPSYFGPSLESADPLLYDRLIRTHQTPAERTSERAAKGFAGTLEADLLRSEAKLDEVKARPRPSNPSTNDDNNIGDPQERSGLNGRHTASNRDGNGINDMSMSARAPAPDLTPLPVPADEFTTLTRDEAHQQWIETMTARFVSGEDREFEYDAVDGDEGLDDVRGEERDREEEWFDREEEGFVPGSGSEDGGEGEGKGRELKGETGVQDF